MNSFIPVEKAKHPQREQMLEMLLSKIAGMVYRCRMDTHWTMEFVSEGCTKLTGYHPEELQDNAVISYENLTHPDDRAWVRTEIEQAVASGTSFSIEYRLVDVNGTTKWVWERGGAMPSETDNGQILQGFIQDITQRHLHEKALLQAERRYRSIFENANEGIFQTTGDGHYLAVNPALVAIYGYESAQELIRDLVNISRQLYVEPGRRDEFTRLMATEKRISNFESRVFRKDGSIIWISENAHTVHDADGNVIYYEGTIADITARKDYEERIAYQATHDMLTGLPNRVLLSERIELAILRTAQTGDCFAVAHIDLDHFKSINDTMGHAAGDLLIKKVAERLQQTLRDADTVARIAGDEFVLVLTHLQRDHTVLIEIMERIIAVIRQPFVLGEREFSISSSVGISFHPTDGMDAATLLRHADIAMYQAKDAGRNQYQFFTEEFNKTVMENHELEHHLRRAIAKSELEIYYQPIVSAGGGAIIKAEALLRWKTPHRGYVSPARFIPIAEKSGLIEPLGAWVIDSVCKQLAEWTAAGFPPMPVSINISPRQFNQEDLLDTIKAALLRHNIDAGLLEIEITENCLARDKTGFLKTLAEMKALGLKVAIDDFGSGYSNMECLKSMLFSTLKIDRSFVINVATDLNHRSIYRALISMAHNLNLVVVAEGVETLDQVNFLHSIDCDLIQGFYFCKPLPAEKFAAFCQGESLTALLK
jgi:diguanylate cyclase (GGDEF)-like protein/PAS domain S-box-containing protein